MAEALSQPVAGQPQSGLWFGKTDDLWQFGKPAGWGGPWWKKDIVAYEASDPYLMTGFRDKVLHLCHDANGDCAFQIEVDFLGDQSWNLYKTIVVRSGEYVHHEFPSGFSAHWVRVTSDTPCRATAYFTYS
jgi:hypothetical protein